MSEYLIKLTLAISVAYLLYLCFLRKSIDFRWLRFYFISAILISLILPSLKYISLVHQRELISIPDSYLPELFKHQKEIEFSDEGSFYITGRIITWVYLSGLGLIFIRSLIGFIQLGVFIFRYGVSRKNGHKVVFIPKLASPFSFFKVIFIDPESFSEDSSGALLRHENVHVKQWHSLDLLLLELLTILQWFNPLVWKMKKTVRELHEFMADKGTIKEGYSTVDYQQLLLKQVYGVQIPLPVNGFHSSLTKKRILMITNNTKNKKWFTAFALMVVVIIATDSLSRVNIAQTPSKSKSINTTKKTEAGDAKADKSNKTQKAEDKLLPLPPPPPPPPSPSFEKEGYVTATNGEKIYMKVDEQAQFDGGDLEKFRNWILDNLKYPEESAKAKIQGKVVVTFTITKEGKVSGCKVLRGVAPDLDMEAVRVITSSPDWKPAKVKGEDVNEQFTLPINFKLTK